MYDSLLRDEPVVSVVEHLLQGFHGFVRAIQDILMAGRGLRGPSERKTGLRSATRSRSRRGGRWPTSRACPTTPPRH